MRSRIASSLLAIALAVAAAPARGEPTATERAMADSLFKDAKKLLARGKTPEACEKLAASYKLDPAGGTLINLAMCHEIEGKTATAWTEFSEALATAHKARRTDREKAAREHLAALEPRLPHLTLSVPGAVPGLTVQLDGTPVEAKALDTAIPVDPGEHRASATAPGRVPWEAKLTLKEAESRTLTIPPLAAPVASGPPPAPPPVPWKRPAGIAATSAGAVLLGVGIGFGVRAIGLGSQASTACPDRLCSPAGLSAVSDGRSAANLANGTLAAGGVLAAAGVVLLVLSAVTSPETPPTAARLAAPPFLGGTF